MASDTANVKLGVCLITFGGVDLGYTKGGVEVEVSTDTHPVMVDQFGESVINEYITKREVKVKAPLAETTLANLVEIMPGATLNTGSDRVTVTNAIGVNLLSIAKELRLHPIGVTGEGEDFTIPLAATAGAMNFAYKHDDERVFNTEFMGYPDPVTKELFTFGDTTTPS